MIQVQQYLWQLKDNQTKIAMKANSWMKIQIGLEQKVCIKRISRVDHIENYDHSHDISLTVKCFYSISLNISLDFLLFTFLWTLAMPTNTHVASMTTPTPAGLTASVRAIAICFVRRSWTLTRAVTFSVKKEKAVAFCMHCKPMAYIIIGMQCVQRVMHGFHSLSS